MKLFRDRFVSLGRCRGWLLATNVVLTVIVIAFATGAWGFLLDGERIVDTLVVMIWAAIPVFLGPFIGALRRLESWGEVLSRALVLTTVGGVVAVVGFEQVGRLIPDSDRFPHLVGLVMLTWVGALFSSWPSWYRVQEILWSGTLVLGIVQRNDHPVSAVVVFLFAYALSAAVRNLVHNVYLDIRRPRVNLQNARSFAMMGAAVAAFAFVGLYAVFSRYISYEPELVQERSTNSRWGDSGEGVGDGPEEDSARELGQPGDSSLTSDPRSGSGSGAAGSGARGTGRREPQIGYQSRVELADMGSSRDDPTVIAKAWMSRSRSGWRPQLGDLWRVESYRRPIDGGRQWVPEGMQPRFVTSDRMRIAVSSEFPRGARERLVVEVQVKLPTFVSPYYAGSFRLRTNGARLFRRSGTEDLYPEDGLLAGDRYAVELYPLALITREPPGELGLHPDVEYSKVPPPSETGVDLRELARRLFLGTTTISQRVGRLRGFFQDNLSYDLETDWRTDAHPLSVFLLDRQRGDCNYFATAAALLLRAGGVSTRVVSGFSRAEWDAVEGCYLLRNQSAHAWIEIYRPNYGWQPLDPSRWGLPRPGDDGVPDDELPRSDGAVAEDEDSPEFFSTGGSPRSNASGRGDSSSSPSDPESDGRDSPGASGSGSERGDDPASLANDRTTPESGSSGRNDDPEWVDGAATGGIGRGGDDPRGSGAGDGRSDAQGESGILSGLARDLGPSDEENEALAADAAGSASENSVSGGSASEGIPWSQWFVALVGAVAAAWAFWLQARTVPSEEDEVPDRAIVRTLGVESSLPADFRPTSREQAIIYEYQRLQADLAEARHQRQTAETPREHGFRVGGVPESLEAAFVELNRVFYDVVYGRRPASGNDLDRMRAAARRIRKRLA